MFFPICEIHNLRHRFRRCRKINSVLIGFGSGDGEDLQFKGNRIATRNEKNIYQFGDICSGILFKGNSYSGDFAAKAEETEAK